MADDAVDAIRDQRMPWLDGDQPAEPTAEHKDRPDPQHAADSEKSDAQPANGVPVKGPDVLPVRVGRQIGGQQPDQPEGCEHPAVGAILALAGTEVSAGEQRCAGHQENCGCERDQGRVGEEGGKPAPAQDGEPKIGDGRPHDDEREPG